MVKELLRVIAVSGWKRRSSKRGHWLGLRDVQRQVPKGAQPRSRSTRLPETEGNSQNCGVEKIPSKKLELSVERKGSQVDIKSLKSASYSPVKGKRQRVQVVLEHPLVSGEDQDILNQYQINVRREVIFGSRQLIRSRRPQTRTLQWN